MSLSTIQSWNIGIGECLFKYRNALFPFVFLVGAATMRPRILLGIAAFDHVLIGSGIAVAAAGEMFRLVTIGFDYIHRGGKNGQVYADNLVQAGMYGVTRNPMYVGNATIAIGMTLVLGAPLAYAVVIPLFLFIYQAIISAEEHYLRQKFGREYDQYCTRVNRFLPSLHGIAGLISTAHYDWKRALRQDLSTITGLLIGLIYLPILRTYMLKGFPSAEAAALRATAAAAGVGIVYAFLLHLKKRKRFPGQRVKPLGDG